MDTLLLTRLFVGLAALFCLAGLAWRLQAFLALPYKPEQAPPKGRVIPGLLYAFTMAMAPWSKESTRRHLLAYVRGILFHIGIFTSLALLPLSLFPGQLGNFRLLLAVPIGLGALGGWAGFGQRLVGERERALSTPDDFAAVALVSLFMTAAFTTLLNDAWLAAFYTVSAIMLIYLPFSKMRHFLYFFFSRFFFGIRYSRRGAIGWSSTHLEG